MTAFGASERTCTTRLRLGNTLMSNQVGDDSGIRCPNCEDDTMIVKWATQEFRGHVPPKTKKVRQCPSCGHFEPHEPSA